MDSVDGLRKKADQKDIVAYNRLYEIASRKGKKTDQSPFSEEEIAKATYFVFLTSYHISSLDKGRRCLEIILTKFSEKNYQSFFNTCMMNAAFYTMPIGIQTLHNLKQQHFKDENNLNPFLFRDERTGGYVAGARVMSLKKNRGTNYEMFIYDKNRNLLHVTPLHYQFGPYKKYNHFSNISRVEDARVINFPYSREGIQEDRVLASGTTMDTHPEGITKMSLFFIEFERGEDGFIRKCMAKNLTPLRGYEDDMRQKNWLPFFSEGKLCFIYKSDPITILEAEKDEKTQNYTGNVKLLFKGKTRLAYKHRGSTPPVPYGNEGNLLYATHISFPKERIYYHRFIEMSKSFELLRMSRLFYFERCNNIEFAIGMIPEKGNYLVGYGVKDVVAKISFLDTRMIEEAFKEREEYLTFL